MNNKIAIIYKNGKEIKRIDCLYVETNKDKTIVRGYVGNMLTDLASFRDVEYELKAKS